MAQTDFTAPPGKQEVIVTRILNAPREVVFKTITDPLLIPQWWGPRRLSTKVINMIVIPGGTWRFLQYDQESKEYGFHGVYHEVLSPERLIYTSEYDGMPGHVTLYTDKFIERDGKTIMTSITVFPSVEDRDQMLQWGMEEGTTEMTNRLNDLFAMESSQVRKEAIIADHEGDGRSITITRTFNAPRERVWQEWTNPDMYMCWWGPKDFTAPYAKFDLHVGGKFLSCMRGPDGKEYWDTGMFREVKEPKRIVYTDTFADEKGNPVPASYYGLPGDEPVEMEVELTLQEVGGKTTMTLKHCGFADTEMARQATEGWNQSFDKLAKCLG